MCWSGRTAPPGPSWANEMRPRIVTASERITALEVEACETPGFDWPATLALVEAEIAELVCVADAIRDVCDRQAMSRGAVNRA